MLPLSLYIHIPWCIRKCPYCDFNSHKSPSHLPENDYIRALLHDLDHELTFNPPREIISIFIGGGTPSLFSAQAYAFLFEALQKRLTFHPQIEITLEANPGTLDEARFKDYRTIGINRLSLGIQSFNELHLKTLGRIHDATQAKNAVRVARKAGFDNINLDLMHGLPHQSIQEGLCDLETALSFEPEHLSWYQLTIEPNTVFYKTKPVLPLEDDCAQLEEEGLNRLQAAGLNRYEISAFSRANAMSRHNLNYWLFGDYYGIGAGAHGKYTTEDFQIIRTQKHRMPQEYMKHPFAQREPVKSEDLTLEFILNTTRLEQPLLFSLFTERTGLTLDHLMPGLFKAKEKGLVQMFENAWQVTALGRRYTNDLQVLFLSN